MDTKTNGNVLFSLYVPLYGVGVISFLADVTSGHVECQF